MKITITSPKAVAPQITLDQVVEKMNQILTNPTFFKAVGNTIIFPSNANVEKHTKFCLILGLYFGSLYNTYGCYLALGYGGERGGEFTVGSLPLTQLYGFVESLSDIENVKVEIN